MTPTTPSDHPVDATEMMPSDEESIEEAKTIHATPACEWLQRGYITRARELLPLLASRLRAAAEREAKLRESLESVTRELKWFAEEHSCCAKKPETVDALKAADRLLAARAGGGE